MRVDFALEIETKKREFEGDLNIPVAAELMFLANAGGDQSTASVAAQFIRSKAGDGNGSTLVSEATRILEGRPIQASHQTQPEVIAKEARRLLALDYRNPILLMDLALALTNLGHSRSAERYVRSAISLAPNSRFVTRAAARFYLHAGDADHAHLLLRRSPLIASDSWVQAAEIATSTVRGKTSDFTKPALRRLARMEGLGVNLSELASAVATVEMANGSEKSAKRLFQRSLLQPTDNSLAQAEWAANDLRLIVDHAALETPLSFEANSNYSYRQLQMREAIRFAKDWAEDEPYSSRPFGALSYLYSLEEDFPRAREAAERALQVDAARDISLELNLLFAMIEVGDLDKANELLARLAAAPNAKDHTTHLLANGGALAYAFGSLDLGRDLYGRAIKSARASRDSRLVSLAQAFFARAALRAGDPAAEDLLRDAVAASESRPSPGAAYVVGKLVDPATRQSLESAVRERVVRPKWQWDATSNTLRRLL